MHNNIKIEIERYLEKYPPAMRVYKMLIQAGNVYVMGGLLREYKDNNEIIESRDADFTIDIKNWKLWNELLEQIPHKRNRFGGYKFLCSGFIVDIWDVRKTWAFERQIIKIKDNDYLKYLSKSVFLNLDALVYDLTNDRWNDCIYQDAMKSSELGVVLRKNPFEKLNVLRAMILRAKYNMRYSEELARIISDHAQSDSFLEKMIKVQQERYGYIILNEDEIRQEVLTANGFTSRY